MRRVAFSLLIAAVVAVPATSASAETSADKAMAQEIGQRLKDSGRLRNYRINVRYEDGVAWLTGSVASTAQRDQAVNLTKEMPSVAHVVNRLEIAGAPASGSGTMSAAFSGVENDTAPALELQALPEAPGTAYQQRAVTPIAGRQAGGNNMPVPMGRTGGVQAAYQTPADASFAGGPMVPMPTAHVPGGARAASYDNAQMPGYAWPSYAAYPNYTALTYPQQYSPSAWPYIGPFYPYPQVPLAWRKVSLEWDDGWWFLDFSAHNSSH